MGCKNTKPPKQEGPNPKRNELYIDKSDPLAPQSRQNIPDKPIAKQITNIKKIDKMDKKVIDQILYLHPVKVVEMAYKDEKAFINLIKLNGVKNLAIYTGYEADPPIVLQSGKRVSTLTWNPLTFALILQKTDLFNFIVKDVNFNLKILLEAQPQQLRASQINSQMFSKDELMTPLFQLMYENQSSLVKVFANELLHLMRNGNIKALFKQAARSENSGQNLEVLLQSRAFKQLYYQKVKAVMKTKVNKEIKTEAKPYLEFINALQKAHKNRDNVQSKVSQLIQKTINGDLSGVKGKIGNSDIPKEAVPYLLDPSLQEQTIHVNAIIGDFPIELSKMNAIEIACALSKPQIVQYFIVDLQLKSFRDFQMNNKGGLLNEMHFMVGAILRKDHDITKILLEQSQLWTYDDFKEITGIMKQCSFVRGIHEALESKTAQEIFINLNLQDRFRFVRDFLALPYKIDISDSQVDLYQEENYVEQSARSQQAVSQKKKNLLSAKDQTLLSNLIKTKLVNPPYISAYLFQEFAKRKDTYKNELEVEKIPADPADTLNFLKIAIETVDDLDLHEYIHETHGAIVNYLENTVNMISMNLEGNSDSHLSQMKEQISKLIGKIQGHQTYIMIKGESSDQDQENILDNQA
ncbi:UNKNOWN [Stylonychia lemnae]|uniref:Uncharacterized protein n=1 Tax=Stylonychia lemnae TaxID=5949 RepID=A0A078AHV1_STYLE|nr:UNKNOWN [Stylonychia lemnae]|eukprot:CDW81476.1 UNKNOWN [Stylonychia lemnae]